MAQEPRSIQDVYETLEGGLKNRITKLTNFTQTSFNFIWTIAFSEQIRENEIQALAAELSGWIDYVGGPINEDDLRELGLDGQVEPEELNQYMDDEDLDEYVDIVGLDRFEGSKATGTVDIQTQSASTEIPEGTVVTTASDSDDLLAFETTESAQTADGVTEVTDVPIIAEEVGYDYNIPAGSIGRFESPPIGVKDVTNPDPTSGGEPRESNEELRTRAKQAVQSSSDGGTTDGIKGFIRKKVDGVGEDDVVIEESTDTSPPFVDVIVDGGTDEAVIDAIEGSRPTGIRHNLIRPQRIRIGFETQLWGDSIDTDRVSDEIIEYIDGLGVQENLYRDALVRDIMTSSTNITNIDSIGGFIEGVNNEIFTYDSSTTEYRLDFTYDDVNGSISVEDESGDTYGEGSDFTVEDRDNDGWPETLVWSGTTPADGDRFFVDYDVTVPGSTDKTDYYDLQLVRSERFTWNDSYSESEDYEDTQDVYPLEYAPFPDSLTITDASGDSYTLGTDYDLVDTTGNGVAQSIDWSIGGSSPDDNEVFTAEYAQQVYQTRYDVVESLAGEIIDEDGTIYEEDTAYNLISYRDGARQINAIEWTTQPSDLATGEQFYLTYLNEGDLYVGSQEKITAGTINVTEVDNV